MRIKHTSSGSVVEVDTEKGKRLLEDARQWEKVPTKASPTKKTAAKSDD